MLRLTLLAVLAAAAAAATAPAADLVQLAAEGPYGDPAADAAREALADTAHAWSANREWSDGTPPLIEGRDSVQHATVELDADAAPAVPGFGTGPESALPPAESTAEKVDGKEGLTESDTGAPDGEPMRAPCRGWGAGARGGRRLPAPRRRRLWWKPRPVALEVEVELYS